MSGRLVDLNLGDLLVVLAHAAMARRGSLMIRGLQRTGLKRPSPSVNVLLYAVLSLAIPYHYCMLLA
jgi:hypothetical protein